MKVILQNFLFVEVSLRRPILDMQVEVQLLGFSNKYLFSSPAFCADIGPIAALFVPIWRMNNLITVTLLPLPTW